MTIPPGGNSLVIYRRSGVIGFLAFVVAALRGHGGGAAGPPEATIRIETPMPPPSWALLERELLRSRTRACEEFFEPLFRRPRLPRLRRALGRRRRPRRRHRVRQRLAGPPRPGRRRFDPAASTRKHGRATSGSTPQAKTIEVPFARDGMYYKEFPVMFDWLHHGEGLSVFNLQGLCDPQRPTYRQRVTRFAGFYLNDDPGAPNYDPRRRRSSAACSTAAAARCSARRRALDWAGDPIEVEGRFRPGHGERSYAPDARALQGLQRHHRRPSP